MRRVAPLFGLLWLACEASPPPAPPAPTPPPAPEVVTPAPPPVRPGPRCSYHGWCWQNPLPQGNDLHGVHAVDGEVVAVGERGTIVRRRDGAWSFEDAPTRERLRGVWGPSAERLYAVGDAGTVLSYEDGAWTAAQGLPAEAAGGTFWAVDGDADGNVYAVGADGLMLRRDTDGWHTEAVETEATLVDVVVSASGVYAIIVDWVGSRAVVIRRGEDGWEEVETFTGDLDALLVSDEDELVVAGVDARHRPAGGSFTTESLHLERPVLALFGDGQTAFAVGYDGVMARWDGARWSEQPTLVEHDLFALAGTDADDVWAVGADGIVLHWDGASWTRDGEGSTAHLKGVWGFGSDDVWAVGDHVTLHGDGQAWTAVGPAEHDLRALFGVGEILIAAGDDGALYRFAEGVWSAEHRAAGEELNGAWGADAEHLFAVGKDVWLEREDGAWTEHADRPDAAGAWGADRDDVWVAGREGLHHWDGTAWTAVRETSSWVLFAVWGSRADDVWAVGAGGRILRFDGEAWTAVEAPTRQNLLGIWGRGPDDVWAVGHHGTILHFDGTRWRWRDSGTDELLHAVWGTPAGDVFVVGHGGTVLRHGAP